ISPQEENPRLNLLLKYGRTFLRNRIQNHRRSILSGAGRRSATARRAEPGEARTGRAAWPLLESRVGPGGVDDALRIEGRPLLRRWPSGFPRPPHFQFLPVGDRRIRRGR